MICLNRKIEHLRDIHSKSISNHIHVRMLRMQNFRFIYCFYEDLSANSFEMSWS